MKEEVTGIDRLKEIIRMAHELCWIRPPNNASYPSMQLSEVEKCMIAMFDDSELRRMRGWTTQKSYSYRPEQKEA